MSQCNVRTEPERISGKWVEVMQAGEGGTGREKFVFSKVLSTANII
jgi:hypothetical protein